MSEEEVQAYYLENNYLTQPSNVTKLPPVFERGVITALEHRAIGKSAAEKYKVETLFNGSEKTGVAFNYFNSEGIYAQKIKHLNDKDHMTWNGNHSAIGLFGQELFPEGGKYITITEGEEDALATYEMLKASNPAFEPVVVSVPDGAGSAEKACKRSWEFVNSFENIILAFDGDDVGRRAAERVVKLFDYKPKVLLFPAGTDKEGKSYLKDANDYKRAGRDKEFVNLWWRAERHTPEGVLSFKSLWDAMTADDKEDRVDWPWMGLNHMTGGWHTGDFVIIKAKPKIGKTQLLRELAYNNLVKSKFNTGLIFLEDTKKSIGLGMCSLHMKKPIQFGNIPYTLEELQKAHEFMSVDDRLTLFDPEDDRTSENIYNKIKYFVKAHDCRFIILDHLSMLTYQSEDNDERRFLDKLCADLKEMTTSLNIGIAAVIHVNDDGKTRGSRAPVQLCNILINLERDKLNPDKTVANTTEVIVEENRRTGDSGLACKLFFNRETGRMEELDDLNLNSEREVKFDE